MLIVNYIFGRSATKPLFYDDGSYDPDGGLIVKYEWDWNNDLVFDEEGSGSFTFLELSGHLLHPVPRYGR